VDGTEKKAQAKGKKALKENNQRERKKGPFREISEED
jgi:hypothetical protein